MSVKPRAHEFGEATALDAHVPHAQRWHLNGGAFDLVGGSRALAAHGGRNGIGPAERSLIEEKAGGEHVVLEQKPDVAWHAAVL